MGKHSKAFDAVLVLVWVGAFGCSGCAGESGDNEPASWEIWDKYVGTVPYAECGQYGRCESLRSRFPSMGACLYARTPPKSSRLGVPCSAEELFACLRAYDTQPCADMGHAPIECRGCEP